jgi:nucleotide-binding universal stress UspA family protein
MKKILFPTDFSEAANKAFIYALHLAAKTGAAITTLHAYPEPPQNMPGHLPRTLEEFYENYALEELHDYKKSIPVLQDIQAQHGFDHVSVNHALRPGKAVDAIRQAAKEEQADLIVMGTTGATGLKKLFLGSVAGAVLESAPCPVLAVPEKNGFDGQLDQIAFTISYQEEEQKALHQVIAISAPFEAHIHCINVDLAHTDFHTHAMDKFKAPLEGIYPHLHFHVLEGNSIEGAIVNFLKEQRIDILAMIAHKRSFLEELFSYSRAKMMSYHSDTPILAIPAHTIQ